MVEEITRQVKEEATQRTEQRKAHIEEVERMKNKGHQCEEDIFKHAEEIKKRAQEAIAAALAGKEEAERRSTNLMEETEKRIQKAVEEVRIRVERQEGNPHTKRQQRVIQNLEEAPDSEADIEAVQNLVWVPTAGPSNRGMDEPSLAEHHSRDMNQGEPAQTSRVHFEVGINVMESKVEEMSVSSQSNEKETEEDEEEVEEVDETGKRKGRGKEKEKQNENKASNPSSFSNILAQCSSKDSTTDSGMATDTSSRAVLHPQERIKRLKKLQQIFGNDRIDEESLVVHKRPTKRKLFPQSSLHGYRAMRAARLTAIRESMNRLMNISTDAEIHKVDCITEEQADNFEEGAVGPELNPMHLYLDTSKHTRWNNELAELFVEHLQEEEEGVTFTQKDKEMVEEMFLACLGQLSRTWREYWTLSPEGREKKRRRMRGLVRRNTRRVDVSYSLCEDFAFQY
ncbi:hypothetical protein BYT27DRAFT_7256879 [Phlegmacium glaucopus]|nr:hypothetical protein BYT27DRAFT_7256879 [Phlegmacium glaucopus]